MLFLEKNMSTITRPRGARFHIELDEELTQALDEARKNVRLKRKDFVRWILARQILGTHSHGGIAEENGR